MIVYLLENTINGKRYVGQTMVGLVDRLCDHRNKTGLRTAIARAIRRYGWKAFTCRVLEECGDIDELNAAEVRWIATLRTNVPVGYNIAAGGKNQRLSEAHKKSIRRGVAWMRGRRVPDSVRQKIGVALKGRVMTATHRQRLSEAARRVKREPEGWRAMRAAGERYAADGYTIEHRKALSLKCGTRKLTVKQVLRIRRLCSRGGESQAAIGRRFGIGQVAVSRIYLRQSFAWLKD